MAISENKFWYNIHYDDILSMLFYLDLTIKENIEWLCNYISETYSNLFKEIQKLYKAELICDKLFKAAKQKAKEIQ